MLKKLTVEIWKGAQGSWNKFIPKPRINLNFLKKSKSKVIKERKRNSMPPFKYKWFM